jgi:hemolysin III
MTRTGELEMPERLSVEELANCLTHGAGLILSIIGSAVLIILASSYGQWLHIVSGTIYGITLILLYAASTLYHSSKSRGYKNIFQSLDHCAIYLLIAGTYTPFTMITLKGGLGWILCSVVWILAVSCIAARLFAPERFKSISAITYLVLGWLSLVAIKPVISILPLSAVALLMMGGIAYTAGIMFLGARRIPHNHAIWHLFVLFGSICHYVAVLLYVIPRDVA